MKHFTEQQNKEWLAGLPKKSVAVKVIIKSTQSNILLVKPTYKKSWQLPGGGVEPFEEPRQAAVRELTEELGLSVVSTDLHIVGTAFREEHDNLLLIYLYAIELDENTSFQLQEDEVEGIKFDDPAKVQSQISDYYAEFWKEFLRNSTSTHGESKSP